MYKKVRQYKKNYHCQCFVTPGQQLDNDSISTKQTITEPTNIIITVKSACILFIKR